MQAIRYSKSYKGDVGLLRACLMLAGFCDDAACTIFNDDSKAVPKRATRRLKLWWANSIFDAPQEQQWALKGFLEEAFGDRIIEMKFVEGYRGWYSSLRDDKSLVIKLRDDTIAGKMPGSKAAQTGSGKSIFIHIT